MKYTFFLAIILFIFTGFIMSNKKQEYSISKGEQLVNGILTKTAINLEKKYNIKSCGTGAAMPGGPVKEHTLCFETKSMLNKEQLRKLLIILAQELLTQVNENNEIQEFLKERPFTIKNIQIILYNHDKEGREVYDPNISGAQIAQGILTYRTVNKSDTFKFKDQFEESYDEALKSSIKTFNKLH